MREVIEARGGGGVLAQPGDVGNVVGEDGFIAQIQAQQRVEQARFSDARLPGENADAAGQCRFQIGQARFFVAGDHQHAIADMAIDIHLLINKGAACVIQQVGFIQHQQRLDAERFARDQIAVDNIQRQLRHDGGDDDDLVDVRRDRLHAVVEVGARQHRMALMHRFDDAFYRGAAFNAGTPEHAIAGHQRANSAANIAAVNLTCAVFYVRMHAEAADDDAVLRFAKQAVIRFRLIRTLFETAFVVSVNATLLAFRQFIFTHSSSHALGRFRLVGQNVYDTPWAELRRATQPGIMRRVLAIQPETQPSQRRDKTWEMKTILSGSIWK